MAYLHWDGTALRLRYSVERSPKEVAAAAPMLRAARVMLAKYSIAATGAPQSGREHCEAGELLAAR